MKWSLAAILLLGISQLLLSTSGLAKIEFNEILSYTIPGYESITVEGFADVDMDGTPEILARNEDHLLIYNQATNSIIYETNLRTYEDKDFEIEFANIAGNSIPEIAIAYAIGRDQGQDTLFIVDVIDIISGENNFSYYPFKPQYSYYGWSMGDTTCNIAMFKINNVDKDPGNEIILSYFYNFQYGVAYLIPATAARSAIIEDFADGEVWSSGHIIYDTKNIIHNNTENLIISVGTKKIAERHGIDLIYYSYCSHIFNSTNDSNMAYCVETGINDDWFICPDVTQTRKAFEVICCGNLLPESEELEILVNYSYHIWCEPDYYTLDTSLFEQRLYTVIDHDFLELKATFPYTNYPIYLYDPDFPGYYFVPIGAKLYQYYAINGKTLDSTSNFPSGSKSWHYPFGDDKPCLVGIINNIVRVYAISKSTTSANGEEPLPIPDLLSLGNPYPNPFNNCQTIPVTISRGSELTVEVYNLLGQQIETIYQGKPQAIGEINITWNPRNIPSGIYFIKATAGNESRVVRSILLK